MDMCGFIAGCGSDRMVRTRSSAKALEAILVLSRSGVREGVSRRPPGPGPRPGCGPLLARVLRSVTSGKVYPAAIVPVADECLMAEGVGSRELTESAGQRSSGGGDMGLPGRNAWCVPGRAGGVRAAVG
ncbi:hypothetical protein Sfulv_12870 [Streptomyces fulvorobeus]|uniref:Uncharacterized protein n=1 Tax=Streptomyces fulvorobeus TaxID=284028 RepID=A0A7J0C421_9ACTN|nr:hypothetical protein Sfulv_12870 [Streptomyces fulvorobeus]